MGKFSANVCISSSIVLWTNENNSSDFSVEATFNAADFVPILLVVSDPKIKRVNLLRKIRDELPYYRELTSHLIESI